MGRVTARRPVMRISADRRTERPDTLAVEEPLEIRVSGEPLTVTMRTPGDDFDLVAGFLTAEGVIQTAADLPAMRICTDADETGAPTFNVVDVTLAAGLEPPAARAFATTSACGVCGTASIDLLRRRAPYDLSTDQVRLAPGVLPPLPARRRGAPPAFQKTGGGPAAMSPCGP